MKVTVDIPGVIQYLLLGWEAPDDDMVVIGHSRVAYLSDKDPGHVFLPAAIWHDACYAAGASIQTGPDSWPRWRVDAHFQKLMLDIAKDDLELQKEACTLYLAVCMFAGGMYKMELSDGVRARWMLVPCEGGRILNSASLMHNPVVPDGSILSKS